MLRSLVYTSGGAMRRVLRVLVMSMAAMLVDSAPRGALADQADLRLDPLFQRLQSAASETDAAAVEQQIWQIWIESDDSTVSTLMREGMTAMSRGDYDGALEQFNRMVDAAPEFAEGWNKRATLHYYMGRYEASVLDIQQTLQLEPRHFGALSGLGLIYDALEQRKAAIRSFEAALEINPHLGGIRERIEQLRQELEGRAT